MGKKYSKEYEVHFYEADYNLDCTMTSIINILADVGTEQSEKLGGGIQYLIDKNMAWVFYQYDVKVNRYPKYGEKLKATTEARGFKKFYAIREYNIYDEAGNKVVEAQAIFFLINMEKRKTMRIPEDQYKIYGLDSDIKDTFKIERLEKLEEVTYKKDFKIRYSDIDFNRHVNNAKYVEWAIESLPLEVVRDFRLENIKVTFEKECTYGEEICALSSIRKEEDGTLTSIHRIENKDGVELTKLIGTWGHI